MKIHVGSGSVYLKDYINIDACPDFFIDNAPPEILEMNTTVFSEYYKNDFGKGSGKCIADLQGSSNVMPFLDGSVEEIVMMHALEHIPSYDVGEKLKEFNRILKINGELILGVPDIKETAKILANAKTPEEEDWAIRLIHGTQKNRWSHHFCGYTERTLKNLLSEYGFGNFEILPNINFYPAIHIKSFKLETK